MTLRCFKNLNPFVRYGVMFSFSKIFIYAQYMYAVSSFFASSNCRQVLHDGPMTNKSSMMMVAIYHNFAATKSSGVAIHHKTDYLDHGLSFVHWRRQHPQLVHLRESQMQTLKRVHMPSPTKHASFIHA